jgi:hypothetical protein
VGDGENPCRPRWRGLSGATLQPSVEPAVTVFQPQRRSALAPGRKIVVLPPDSCDPSAIRHGTGSAVQDLASTRCGNLMSALEVELGQHGYKTLSWQTLRTGGNISDRYQAAAKLGAEIVIEIDQFGDGPLANNDRQVTAIQYGEMQAGQSMYSPVGVGDVTRMRCRAMASQIQAPGLSESAYEAVLSAKAVDPVTGDVLWYYRNAKFEGAAGSGEGSVVRTFPAPYTDPLPIELEYEPGETNGLQKAGGFVGILGVAPILGAVLVAAINSEEPDPGAGDAAAALAVTGGLMIGAGILLGAIGNGRMDAYNEEVLARGAPRGYLPPDQVLCIASMQASGVPAGDVNHAAAPSVSSSDVLITETSRRAETEDPRRQKVIAAITKDFATQLTISAIAEGAAPPAGAAIPAQTVP